MADEQKTQPDEKDILINDLKFQVKELTKQLDETSPEAIYSFSTSGLTRDELGANWTIRARPGENGQSFFHRADNFLQYAIAHGWKLPPAPQAAPPMTQTLTAPVSTGTTVPPAPAATPANANGACTCVLMKVGKSYKGDKPQLVFEVKEQTDPLKFTGKTVDDLIRFLSPVGQYTPAHLVIGAKFNVDYILRWSRSADGRYQNIDSIER